MGNPIFDAIDSLARSAVKQFLTIQFTPEQKAEVKAVLGVEVPFGQVPIKPPKPSISVKYGIIPPRTTEGSGLAPVILKYGMPLGPAHPRVPLPSVALKYGITTPMAHRVYLTTRQRQQIQSATGCVPCDYLEVQRGMRLLYGLPLIHE